VTRRDINAIESLRASRPGLPILPSLMTCMALITQLTASDAYFAAKRVYSTQDSIRAPSSPARVAVRLTLKVFNVQRLSTLTRTVHEGCKRPVNVCREPHLAAEVCFLLLLCFSAGE
jgi:hypothetical protein